MFLVAGPGRTGSVFLFEYLKTLFAQSNLRKRIHSIKQTHNATLQLPYETVVIQCRRKNLFEHTLSSVIAQYTNEWTEYSQQSVSLHIDLRDFESKYLWNLRWFEAFEHFTSYKHRVNLYFEDFITNPGLINRSLDLPLSDIVSRTRARPRALHTVTNLTELQNFFQELQADPGRHNFPIEQRDWSWQLK